MEDSIRPVRRCGTRVFGTFVAASVTALALFGVANGAHAAGFALKEQSAAAQGNSFAGATAGAEDVTYMFFNPAGLTRLDDHAAAVVVSYIIPQADITNASASTAAPVNAPITGSTNDGAVNALVPAFYAAYSHSPDLKFGLAINTPFGLTTDYDADWIGRYHALESSLMTVNINPVVAYRVNERFSIGGGIQAEYADATLSNAIDFGTLAAVLTIGGPPADPAQDGSSELTGDDWAFGFNVGLLYELSEATRFGLNYRSEIDHTLEGNVVFDTSSASGTAVAGNGTFGPFTNTGGRASLVLPQMVTAGAYHQINDRWAIMGEVAWTGWSSLDEIRVTFDNTQPDSVTTTNWEDVWFVALGATWQANEKWTLRGGVGYDQSPIPEANRTPRIPDSDRTWLSLGAKFQPRHNFTVDAGYTHIFFGDAPVNLTADPFGPGANENTGRGNLAFDSDISIDILTVQGTFRF